MGISYWRQIILICARQIPLKDQKGNKTEALWRRLDTRREGGREGRHFGNERLEVVDRHEF